jgi:hypothetical protein
MEKALLSYYMACLKSYHPRASKSSSYDGF